MWAKPSKLPLSPNPTPPPRATPGPAESNFLSVTPSLRSRNRPFASALAKGAKSNFLADRRNNTKQTKVKDL